MPTLKHIGSFKLTSPMVVITDPGYDEETARMSGLGCFVSDCRIGKWRVEITLDTTPQRRWEMPRIVMAICDEFPTPLDRSGWERVGKPVGGDGGVLGIYDFAHFHDHSLVPQEQRWSFDGGPAIPDDLWYSLNCEAIQGHLAAVIPHGVVVHWDGGMHVDILGANRKVFAVRLSISGWPDNI
jgi:hypothetical protein